MNFVVLTYFFFLSKRSEPCYLLLFKQKRYQSWTKEAGVCVCALVPAHPWWWGTKGTKGACRACLGRGRSSGIPQHARRPRHAVPMLDGRCPCRCPHERVLQHLRMWSVVKPVKMPFPFSNLCIQLRIQYQKATGSQPWHLINMFHLLFSTILIING